MQIDFTGKSAFITGGSKGIGKAIAELLADCGADVAVMARGQAGLEAATNELKTRGRGRVLGIQGDVSDAVSISAAVQASAAEFGGLHLAVNNAGIAGHEGLLHETGADNWRTVMGINLDGVAYAMMAEIREMLRTGGGSIVNIASVEAHGVLKGFPAYTASKHAISGLTKSAAADYAVHGIRINSVSPGVITTPLTMAEGQKEVTDRLAAKIPLGRLGTPAEIANTVAFLLSDQSSYTTGADILVDGAFVLRE
jgi:NAD(P)-dependent dehydrogenase (short-subunit alcohol dehydrogenase family)